MSDWEMPSKFLFEGEPDELDVSLAVLAGVDDLFLLDKTTPTGITMASMAMRMIPMMPEVRQRQVSRSFHDDLPILLRFRLRTSSSSDSTLPAPPLNRAL